MVVAVAILAVVAPGILLVAAVSQVSPAAASQNTQERILRGTEIISGTEEISFMEIHFSLITHTGMTIRTTATMTRMPVTIPESFLPCSRS